MKGIVFVELLKMAEEVLGEEVVDEIIESSELASGGAYSAVGNYPCSELMTLVQGLSAHTGTSQARLQHLFGEWMHRHFVTSYPGFFVNKPDALAMLSAIDAEVHVEVRKLYPDAELPTFEVQDLDAQGMRMVYRSPRPLADFCHGLVDACITHFGRPADVVRKDCPATGGGAESEFTITYRT
ncbi:MAG: heme NO-binding domain-containing protein [Natronohydrobacter sp.]|nr:heme NO-binding domain-containing protein [Natronohydrobacter sp.]